MKKGLLPSAYKSAAAAVRHMECTHYLHQSFMLSGNRPTKKSTKEKNLYGGGRPTQINVLLHFPSFCLHWETAVELWKVFFSPLLLVLLSLLMAKEGGRAITATIVLQ